MRQVLRSIPLEDITDVTIRRKVMLIDENIRLLNSQLADLRSSLSRPSAAVDEKGILDTARLTAESLAATAKADAISKAQELDTATKNAATAEVQTLITEAKQSILSSADANAQAAINQHAGNKNIHVTQALQTAWNRKYEKPAAGIPKADMAEDVRQSLGKADSALQSVPSISPADIGAAPANYVKVESFSTTTGTVNYDSSGTASVNVALAGYTPVLVGNVRCYGNGNYYRWIKGAFKCTECMISDNTVSFTVDMCSQVQSMSVTVDFEVMYLKD